jgi:hypothetical protein
MFCLAHQFGVDLYSELYRFPAPMISNRRPFLPSGKLPAYKGPRVGEHIRSFDNRANLNKITFLNQLGILNQKTTLREDDCSHPHIQLP